jgi:hypothetical protein
MMLKSGGGLLRTNPVARSEQSTDLAGGVNSAHFNKHVLQEAVDKIQECTVRAVCGREYVRTGALQSWLVAEVQTRARVRKIMDAATRHHNVSLFLSKHQILDRGDIDCCLILFSILLELHLGHLLRPLEAVGIRDRKLPMNLHEIERLTQNLKLPRESGIPSVNELVLKVYKAQWHFCPVNFELGMSERNLYMDHILPVCRKHKLSETATAIFFQIQVQEEFVGPKLKQAVPTSRFYDDQYGWCFHFTLKTFTEGHKQQFEDEKELFAHLQDHDSVLKYLGEYVHWGRYLSVNHNEGLAGKGADVPQTSYNILFEYADHDLGTKLQTKSPPFLPSGIFHFWRSLFEFANAVERLHEYTMTVGRQSKKPKK